MSRTLAILFGLLFIVMGIMGFMPKMAPEQMLMGMLAVNAVQNLIHLIAGVLALWAGISSSRASRSYFKIVGIIFLIFGLCGFYYGDMPLFGYIANNMGNTWAHLILGVLFLYFGFGMKKSAKA